MPITLNGDTGITTPSYGGAVAAEYLVPVTAFKNRIINGGMVFDQRNVGASLAITNAATTYTLDRWAFFENGSMAFSVQRSTTAPVGFINSMLITATTGASAGPDDRSQLFQRIEGFNVADLGWGTANAKTVTLSFWVRSSLTGQFGGAIGNNNNDRSYPFSFTISSANTFEYKTITIPGDTTGTWFTNNDTGLVIYFDLGMGANLLGPAGSWASADYRGATGDVKVSGTTNATLYLTGVQLEVGSTATSWDTRSYGTELQLCQRYYEKSYAVETAVGTGLASGWFGFVTPTSAGESASNITFRTTKRSAPTMVAYNAVTGATGAVYRVYDAVSIGVTLDRIGTNTVGVAYLASGSTNVYYYHWTASSEL